EAVRWIQAFHGERGLGRPVLDPLGFVEHDDVRRPVAHDVEVANELLVIPEEESTPARLERGAALGGRAVDEGGGRVGEKLPFTKPLRLERGWHDEEAAGTRPVCQSAWQAAIACAVLPSPMSSARSRRPRTKKRSTPS